jgi:hypothetical protein
MTLTEMITLYERLSAATAYIFGFLFHGDLYMVKTAGLPLEMLKLDHMSSKRGGFAKVRVRLNATLKAQLVEAGAIKLGAASLLEADDRYNKGERFERLVTESYGLSWTKDSIPFWVSGDISLNGEEIQVKYDGAELTNENLLKRVAA